MKTISFLIHLSDVVPKNGIAKYERAILEQLSLTCPVLSREFLDGMYEQMTRFEKEADERRSAAAKPASSSAPSQTKSTKVPRKRYSRFPFWFRVD